MAQPHRHFDSQQYGQANTSRRRNTRKKSKKRAVPDGWMDYMPVGNTIPSTRIFAFKVPLKEATCLNMSDDERFTPVDLFKILRSQGRNGRLGLVIDLTNTERYYDKTEITEKGSEYVKIFTEGHFVPKPEIVEKFKQTVLDFLARNRRNDRLIGVHCTHGINRTGYLVCRYLIDCLMWTPDEAIQAFNHSRGHNIERQNYLDDLKIRDPRDPDKTEDIKESVKSQMYTNTDFSSDNIVDNRRFSKKYKRGKNDDFVFDGGAPIQSLHPPGYKNAGHEQMYEMEEQDMDVQQSGESYQQYVQACGIAIQLYQEMKTDPEVMQQVIENAPQSLRGEDLRVGDMYDPNTDNYEECGDFDETYEQGEGSYNQGRTFDQESRAQGRFHPYGQNFDQQWDPQHKHPHMGIDGPPHKRWGGQTHWGRGGPPNRGWGGPSHWGRGGPPPYMGRGGPSRGRGGPPLDSGRDGPSPYMGKHGPPPHRGKGGRPFQGRGGPFQARGGYQSGRFNPDFDSWGSGWSGNNQGFQRRGNQGYPVQRY